MHRKWNIGNWYSHVSLLINWIFTTESNINGKLLISQENGEKGK